MSRSRGTWIAFCAFVVAFAALGAPSAFAATTSWEFDATSFNFGSAEAGGAPTEAHEFTLTNTGEAPIQISRRVIKIPEAEAFKTIHSNCSGTLEPGESCFAAIIFQPKTSGQKEGSFRVESSEGLPAATVVIKGQGFGPQVRIEPEHLNFGSIEAGTGPSSPQTITVDNQGPTQLRIYGVSVTDIDGQPEAPSPFGVVGGTCQEGAIVAALSSCTIQVAFDPTQAGSFESKVALADNASKVPQRIALRGTGEAPPVEHTEVPPTENPAGSGSGAGTGSGTGTESGTQARTHTPSGSPSSNSVAPPAPTPPKIVKPVVRIIHRPALVGRDRVATFRFSSGPAGASAECRLDHSSFKPCTSPVRFAHLAPGRHEFKVRVAGGSSAAGSAQAWFRWRVTGGD